MLYGITFGEVGGILREILSIKKQDTNKNL